ncbi:hypothetical protein [Cerasicoccus fimbriatus]|uniref:hypothetical protein n=1 Tax=Cerasicoccus fimbriatus TaxID=3014554 RepID=UPI0022B5C5B5|nr:hypothetical protein [Cerasicoccus sp. TK19100]
MVTENFSNWNCLKRSASLAALSASIIAAPALHADAATDIANARTALENDNLNLAQTYLVNALVQEPSNDEANMLISAVKLMRIVEQPEFSSLMASAGLTNYVPDLFNLSADVEYYIMDAETLTSDAAWTVDTVNFKPDNFYGYINVSCAQSGILAPGEKSILTVSTVDAHTVSFALELETNNFDDVFMIYVDGELSFEYQGAVNWTEAYLYFGDAAPHEIAFVFERSSDTPVGNSFARIDNLRFYGQDPNAGQLTDSGSGLTGALDTTLITNSTPGQTVEIGEPTEFPIFSETFSGDEIATWLDDEIMPTLQEVVDHMDEITDVNFSSTIYDDDMLVDYADTRGVKAVAESGIATITMVNAHNVDVLLRTIGDRQFLRSNPEWFNDGSPVHLQWLFGTFPEFTKLNPGADLATAKAAWLRFWSAYQSAADLILARTDNNNHLFNNMEYGPLPGTEWFVQTVVTNGDGSAVQAGETDSFNQQDSVLSIPVSGPGTIEFWAYFTNIEGSPFPSNYLNLSSTVESWNSFASFNAPETPGWNQYTAFVPDGVTTVHIVFQKYSNPDNTVFIDDMSYTPEGGSPVPLTPTATALDFALGASFGAYSDPAQIGLERTLSSVEDEEFRREFQHFIDSMDSELDWNGQKFTSAPYFSNNVDPAYLRPVFYLNFAIEGTFPDSTFAGILPQTDNDALYEIIRSDLPSFYDVYDGLHYERLMDNQSLSRFFAFEVYESPLGEQITYYLYDTMLDSLVNVKLQRNNGLTDTWRSNGDGLGSDPFEFYYQEEEEPTLFGIEYKDTLFNGDSAFYRSVFELNNGPLQGE